MSGVPYIRTRTDPKTSRPVINRSYWWDTSQSPKPAAPAYAVGPTVGSWAEMTDTVHPGFRRQSAAGEIINNWYQSRRLTSSIETATGPHFRSLVNGVTYWGEIEGVLNSVTSGDAVTLPPKIEQWVLNAGATPNIERLIDLACTAARANVKEPTFDGLVSLGELRETLRYLRNPFKTGLKLADKLNHNLARIGSSGKKAVLGDVMSVYLEFRYAVRPLVKEVEAALLASQKPIVTPRRQTARDYKTSTLTGSYTELGVSTSGILHDVSFDVTRTTLVRAGLLYENIVENGLPDHWGFRLSDLPSAAWELVPLSFVYDWVGNIGDFVGAITPRAGVKTLAGWYSVYDLREVVVTSSNYRLAQPGWTTARAGYSRLRYSLLDKYRVNKLRAPALALRGIDSLQDDALRLLDLISIVQQRLGSVSKSKAVRQANQERMERMADRLDRRQSRSSQSTRASKADANFNSWLDAIH